MVIVILEGCFYFPKAGKREIFFLTKLVKKEEIKKVECKICNNPFLPFPKKEVGRQASE